MSTTSIPSRIATLNHRCRDTRPLVSLLLLGWWLDAGTTIIAMEAVGWGLESGLVVGFVMDALWTAPRWFHDSIGDAISVVTIGYAVVLAVKIAVPAGIASVWVRAGLNEYRFARVWMVSLGIIGIVVSAINVFVTVRLWGV